MLWIGIIVVINTTNLSSTSDLLFSSDPSGNNKVECERSVKLHIDDMSKADISNVYKIVGRCDYVTLETMSKSFRK